MGGANENGGGSPSSGGDVNIGTSGGDGVVLVSSPGGGSMSGVGGGKLKTGCSGVVGTNGGGKLKTGCAGVVGTNGGGVSHGRVGGCID